MFVVKRNGQTQEVKFYKVTKRIEHLCKGLDMNFVRPTTVAKKVCENIIDGVTTQALDQLAAEEAAALVVYHPDYGSLAGRIAVSNLRKCINMTFSEAVDALYNNTDDNGNPHPILSKETHDIVCKHKAVLDAAIKNERDFVYDIFALEMLKRSYLLRTGKAVDTIKETPQMMHMRVAIGIAGDDIDAVLEMYEVFSKRMYTHATPTLFNAGTVKPQLASCFLVAMKDDSLEGIMDTLKECASISKYSGGIGIHAHNIRSTGSLIKGTNGASSGLNPLISHQLGY